MAHKYCQHFFKLDIGIRHSTLDHGLSLASLHVLHTIPQSLKFVWTSFRCYGAFLDLKTGTGDMSHFYCCLELFILSWAQDVRTDGRTDELQC